PPVLLDVELLERAELEIARETIRRHEVVLFLRAIERSERENDIGVVPGEVLLEREVGLDDRIVPDVQGRILPAAALERISDVGFGPDERVLMEVEVLREVEIDRSAGSAHAQ